MNQNPGKPGQDVHGSTTELITGLMQLVPLANMGDISQEAMEVKPVLLLRRHRLVLQSIDEWCSFSGSVGPSSARQHWAVEPRCSYGNVLGYQVVRRRDSTSLSKAQFPEASFRPSVCLSSSQVLFFICKKLFGHQLINSTEILKWLREILICRNKFLLRNKVRCATVYFVLFPFIR